MHDETLDIEGYNLEEMKEKQCDFVCFHSRHMAFSPFGDQLSVFLAEYVTVFSSETINQLIDWLIGRFFGIMNESIPLFQPLRSLFLFVG